MIRERLVGAGLLAYPAEARERLGGEIAGTVLDAGAGSRRRLVRELADLVRLGLRARAGVTATSGARRVTFDGLCLACVWLMLLDLATLLAQTVRGMHDPLLAPASLLLLAVALSLSLVGFDRLAGVAALVWIGARLPALLADTPGETGAVITVTLLTVGCFATLVLAPRRRPRDLRRLAWMIVPVFLAAALGPPPWEQSPLLRAIVVVGALATAAYVLASFTTDPRTAIAAGAVLTAAADNHGAVNLLVIGILPLVVTAATLRIRLLRRRTPI
jgi:hypothetical protein